MKCAANYVRVAILLNKIDQTIQKSHIVSNWKERLHIYSYSYGHSKLSGHLISAVIITLYISKALLWCVSLPESSEWVRGKWHTIMQAGQQASQAKMTHHPSPGGNTRQVIPRTSHCYLPWLVAMIRQSHISWHWSTTWWTSMALDCLKKLKRDDAIRNTH